MYYFILEVTPPLLDLLLPSEAKLAKVSILSKQYEHDIQATIKLHEAIDQIIPIAEQESLYHEYNPMFYPTLDEAEQLIDPPVEEQSYMDEDDFDFSDFSKLLNPTGTQFIYDVQMSSHYKINEPFEHVELYGRVYVTAECATHIDFETNCILH